MKVKEEDRLLEHAVLNEIEADLESKDYEALSELLGCLIFLEPARKLLEGYLGDCAKEDYDKKQTFCRY